MATPGAPLRRSRRWRRQPCGICDFCAPASCAAQQFRTATEEERKALFRAAASLRSGGMKSTGKLHAELYPHGEMSRDAFEEVLGAMARAGLVRLTDAVFEKDGKQIPYRKVAITEEGMSVNEESPVEFIMKAAPGAGSRKRGGRKSKKKVGGTKVAKSAKVASATRSARAPREPHADSRIEEALKKWRLNEARRRGVPAFRIFSDKVLKAVAEARPASARELLAIPGIGMSAVEKYGAQIYRILHEGA